MISEETVCRRWVRAILVGGSETVVPLLLAAAAPWRPSRAGAGNASHKVFPRTVKV